MYCAAIFLHFVQIVSAHRTPETVSNIQNGEARTAYFENAHFDNTSISLSATAQHRSASQNK